MGRKGKVQDNVWIGSFSLHNCLPRRPGSDLMVRMSELTATKVYSLLLVRIGLEGGRRRIDLVASRIVRGNQYVKAVSHRWLKCCRMD